MLKFIKRYDIDGQVEVRAELSNVLEVGAGLVLGQNDEGQTRIDTESSTVLVSTVASPTSKLTAGTIRFRGATLTDFSGEVEVSFDTWLAAATYTRAQIDTALAGKSNEGHTHTFASITSRPTTLSGYGITDAVPTSRTITAGTGLSGGGTLAANRSLALDLTYTDARYARLAQANTFTAANTFTNNVLIEGRVIGGFGARATSGVQDWDHSNNARSGQGDALIGTGATNHPPLAGFYHPFNFEYSSKTGGGNLTQFAIPYYSGTTLGKIFYRGRYTGNWSTWKAIATEDWADTRYLQLSGGTLTGAVTSRLATTGAAAFLFGITGESDYRLIVEAGGRIIWGTGQSTAGRDVSIRRISAGTLKLYGTVVDEYDRPYASVEVASLAPTDVRNGTLWAVPGTPGSGGGGASLPIAWDDIEQSTMPEWAKRWPTLSDIGAAAASHEHSAAQITSGLIDKLRLRELGAYREDDVALLPQSHVYSAVFKFTQSALLDSAPGTGSWRHILQIQTWAVHNSSYPTYQVSFGAGAVGVRQSASSTTWGPWRQLAETSWADGRFVQLTGSTMTGSLQFNGGTTNHPLYFRAGGTVRGRLTWYQNESFIFYGYNEDGSSSGYSLRINPSTGGVGIGRAPEYPLDVSGAARASYFIGNSIRNDNPITVLTTAGAAQGLKVRSLVVGTNYTPVAPDASILFPDTLLTNEVAMSGNGGDFVILNNQGTGWQEFRILDGSAAADRGILFRTSNNSGGTWDEVFRITGSVADFDVPITTDLITAVDAVDGYGRKYASVEVDSIAPTNVRDGTLWAVPGTPGSGGGGASLPIAWDDIEASTMPSWISQWPAADITIDKPRPWLTLDSPNSGDNALAQGAGITIGESGIRGAAALHLTYTGDGQGHIGMGAVGTNGIPENRAMRLHYASNVVTFDARPTVNGAGVVLEGDDPTFGNVSLGTIRKDSTPVSFLTSAGASQGAKLRSLMVGIGYTPNATDGFIRFANDMEVGANQINVLNNYLDIRANAPTYNNGIILRRSMTVGNWANIGMDTDTSLWIGVMNASIADGLRLVRTANGASYAELRRNSSTTNPYLAFVTGGTRRGYIGSGVPGANLRLWADSGEWVVDGPNGGTLRVTGSLSVGGHQIAPFVWGTGAPPAGSAGSYPVGTVWLTGS